MQNFTQAEITQALEIVSSSLAKCEKIQPRFAEGTSQRSLLRNRIKALQIAESLLKDDGSVADRSRDELENALPPIRSIRSKTTHARVKHPEGSTWYQRLTPTIDAMLVCQALMEEELSRRA